MNVAGHVHPGDQPGRELRSGVGRRRSRCCLSPASFSRGQGWDVGPGAWASSAWS